MSSAPLHWIEVFKVGTHTDAAGTTRDWTLDDMRTMVTRYNDQPEETRHVAPFVLGHPLDNSPSYGWTERLALRGTSVWAGLRDVDEGVQEAVNKGRYEKISIALYDDLLLMHIGLLGAIPPAVKGMTPVAFGSRQAAYLFHMPPARTTSAPTRNTPTPARTTPTPQRYSTFTTGNSMNVLMAFVDWIRQNYGEEAANQTQGKIDELTAGVLQSMQEFVTTTFGADVGAAAEAKLAELQAAPQTPPEEPATAASDPAAPAQEPQQQPTPQPAAPQPAASYTQQNAAFSQPRDVAFSQMQRELEGIQRREREREQDDFVEGLIKQGRVVPATKAAVKAQLENAFMSDMKGVTTGAFEGAKKLFSSLPPVVQFGEVATRTGGTRATKAIAENFSSDQSLDTASVKRAEKIKEYAQQHGVSLDVAFTALAKKGEL